MGVHKTMAARICIPIVCVAALRHELGRISRESGRCCRLETQKERDGIAPFRAQAEAVEAATRKEGAGCRLDGDDGGGELLTTSGYDRVYDTATTAACCRTTATHATHA